MKCKSIVGTVIMALLFTTANAAVWYVHPDSAQNCIQDCLDSCSTGDTVLVGEGTYYENITWPNMQGIDLIGENGAASTIIDGGGTARGILMNMYLNQTTVIEGFTIQNGYHDIAGGGIFCGNGASPIIRQNIIKNNETDSIGGGIQCSYNASPLIENNSIIDNVSHAFGAGIGCYENATPTIQNNLIDNNYAEFGSAGICIVGSSPHIIGNTITNNVGDFWFGGIGAGMASVPQIRGNTITGNQAMWGAGIGLEGNGFIIDNEITGNVADSMGGGIASYTNSTATIDSNEISSNSAFKGGGIWVHQFSTPQIRYNTISENSAVSGGGIRCSDYSNPNILGNLIYDNEADSVGGGITCINGSSPTITGNTIRKNIVAIPGGAGIMCWIDCSPYIAHNTIDSNIVYYGAGAGIFCYDNSSPDIRNNTISYNTSTRAAGIEIYMSSSPNIKFNTITYNSSPGFGCGIDCYDNSTPYIDSCTIAYNDGDGIYSETGSDPEIHYVNIYGNTGYGVINNTDWITINAENNWWGDDSGPGGAGPGGGDEVSLYVDYDPWLTDSVVWTGIEEFETTKPVTIHLQISPNPFTNLTTISYGTGQSAEHIELAIYDATGRLVKSFRPTPYALRSTLIWGGRDDQNRLLPSGTYFVILQAGEYTETKKLLLIR